MDGIVACLEYVDTVEEDWTDEQKEALLTHLTGRVSKSETSVYRKLASLKSALIPNLIAEVSCDLEVEDKSVTIKEHHAPFQVKGLLFYPMSKWQSIVD